MEGYGDNAGFEAYAAAAGYTLPVGYTQPQVTAARGRGSMAVDQYEPRISGTRTGGFAQERAWGRTGATTYYGEAIPDGTIPVAIEYASYEAAYLEMTKPGILSPVVTGSSMAKRKKVGQLEIEYAASSSTNIDELVALATPVVTTIEGLLWPFLMPVMPGILVV